MYQTLHPVLREFWPWATDHGVAGLVPSPRNLAAHTAWDRA